jgi:aminoglycoside phosphotransferase (APT) family kinase protein
MKASPGPERLPDAALAAEIALATLGVRPNAVTRFTTGSHHYVFEVRFTARPPAVVRLNTPAGRPALKGAVTLSRRLRPLGVPLPELLAEDTAGPFPYLVLERLPGTDFGETVATLPGPRLAAIAAAVGAAQRIVGGTPSAGRYGFAVEPKDAPHRHWSAVLDAHLQRSRERIAAVGLFGPAAVDKVATLVERARPRLDAQPAIPFLHDTTVKNVIVTADGVFSGIVDVDDLCFGDPRHPAALTLTALLVRRSPTGYVDAWRQAAGFADDALFRLYVLTYLVDFMGEHGQVFNGNQAPSDPAARQRLLELFAENLRLAEG